MKRQLVTTLHADVAGYGRVVAAIPAVDACSCRLVGQPVKTLLEPIARGMNPFHSRQRYRLTFFLEVSGLIPDGAKRDREHDGRSSDTEERFLDSSFRPRLEREWTRAKTGAGPAPK